MALDTETQAKPRTYGNWRRPTTAGLYGLGKIPTFIMLGGLIFSVLVIMLSGSIIRGAISFAIVGGLVALMLMKDRHGRNGFSRIATRVGWSTSLARGTNLYHSGPLSRSPWGTCQLPGLAAGLKLSEHLDSYGRPFALVYCPHTKTFTVVLAAQPDGESLVDVQQVNRWVARWGHWLSDLADEPGLEAASVTIETAPDNGSRLAAEVNGSRDENAPRFALQMLDEIVEKYPRGSATMTAYIALTFNSDISSGSRDAAEVGRDLAARLPALTMGLKGTGAGAVAAMSANHLCEVIRVAYDPAAADQIDQAHAEHARGEGELPTWKWSEVGPIKGEAHWDYYTHDSGLSVSWVMSDAPRGHVQSNVLNRLLQPHRDITRKRVTLLYAPIDPAKAAAIVDADVKAADFRRTANKKPTARDTLAVRSAAATAAEEASGAGLVNFAMVVTATVTNPGGLRQARAAVDMMSATARLRLRPSYGAQDSGFLFSLPLGLIPSRHVKLPTTFTEGL